MTKKIFSSTSYLLFSVLLAIFAVFLCVYPTQASQMSTLDDKDNSIGIVIEKTSDSIDSNGISNAPDLGDDQAFPFIPGFGKNSGKD